MKMQYLQKLQDLRKIAKYFILVMVLIIDYLSSFISGNKNKIKYGISKDLFVIGIVSRQVVEKGLRELFEAFDLIASKIKSCLLMRFKIKSDYAQGVEKELSILKVNLKIEFLN